MHPVWYGLVWIGMVWFGLIKGWFGLVWYGSVLFCFVWVVFLFGLTGPSLSVTMDMSAPRCMYASRCILAPGRRYEPSLVRFGLVWFCMVWLTNKQRNKFLCPLVWFSLVRFGLIWFGWVCFGLVWLGLVWLFGWVVWFGSVWLG